MRKSTIFLTTIAILGALAGSYAYGPSFVGPGGAFKGGGAKFKGAKIGGVKSSGAFKGRRFHRHRGRHWRHGRRRHHHRHWRHRRWRRGGWWGPRYRYDYIWPVLGAAAAGAAIAYSWNEPLAYWGSPVKVPGLPVYYPGYAYWCPMAGVYYKWGYPCPGYLRAYGRYPWGLQ